MFKDILDALPESTPEQRADKNKAMMTVLSRCLRLNRKLACVTKGCKHSKLFNPLKAPKTRTQMLRLPAEYRDRYLTAERKHLDEKISHFGVVTETTLAKEEARWKKELPQLPVPKFNVMRSRWVYACKKRAHSEGGLEISARIVTKGFTQREGVDFDSTSADTMALMSYFINEARAAQDPGILRENWDVKGAFYNASPSHLQLMAPPPGTVFKDKECNLWRLNKCMPGTRDAMYHYTTQFADHMVNVIGMLPNPGDDASFYLGVPGENDDDEPEWVALTVHVDDIGAFSNIEKLLDWVYEQLSSRFPLKRLKGGIGIMLGITSVRTERGIEFTQTTLIDEISELAGVDKDSKKVTTPTHARFKLFTVEDQVTDPSFRKVLDQFPYKTLVGKIAYVRRCTRHDIGWIVCQLQAHQAHYGEPHIEALLHLCKFLHCTRDLPLV